ncbi:MAG: zinc dependent phospholipase C family protein [Deltaproteobacteria bacterium]|nr:zinc dependent phospholipase C family protein [Deltaproteobacteria bacterium]
MLIQAPLILFALFLWPSDADAWAPATHLYFARELFQFSHLLPVSIRMLITQFRPDYLYGCIAADITLGKAFVDYIYNCHNFDVGLSLLGHARHDAEKAFVYGYLSHLAADTVSHNYFIPYQNVEHFDDGRFKHAYWEVRLDTYFGDRVWHEVEEIMRNPRTHAHDRLMDSALRDTIFSFRTNRIFFSSMLAIQRFKKWQAIIKNVNRFSMRQFHSHHLAEYNKLALSGIIRFLSEGKKSRVYLVDPTGAKVMEEAATVRKMLKEMKRAGHLTEQVHQEECQRFRSHVRKLYFEDYPIEDKSFHPSIHMKL